MAHLFHAFYSITQFSVLSNLSDSFSVVAPHIHPPPHYPFHWLELNKLKNANSEDSVFETNKIYLKNKRSELSKSFK